MAKLTEEQTATLEKLEVLYSSRYTEEDSEFDLILTETDLKPPIVENFVIRRGPPAQSYKRRHDDAFRGRDGDRGYRGRSRDEFDHRSVRRREDNWRGSRGSGYGDRFGGGSRHDRW